MNPDLTAIRQEAIKYAKSAIDCEKEQKWEESFSNFKKAIEKLKELIALDLNKYSHETYISKAKEYYEKADYIKKTYLANSQTLPSAGNNSTVPTKSTSNVGASAPVVPNKDAQKDSAKDKKGGGKKDDKDDEENKKLQDALASCIVTEKPNVSWDDVAGLEKAKEALKEAVIFPLKFPQLFTGKRKPWKGILLYGPPGTGKSFLAKACATEAKGTFYSVSASNIMSKWVGEAERTVRALFELARANKPAVIFLDEIDSLLSARGDGEQESSRRVKTEFLVQMQGVGKNDEGILVLGATNIPWDLDPAVRRRFQKKIYISLPELEGRYKMFELNVGNTPNNLGEEDLNELAEITEGYSGSDIATLTQEAVYEPLRKCQVATHFKIIDGNYYVAHPMDLEAKKYSLADIPNPEKLIPPDVCKDDFIKALTRIRPTVSLKDLEKQEQFTEEFGQEG